MADPERRCLVTGDSGPTGGLVRFAIDPAGRVVPDLAGRLPGRGYWLGASRATVDLAVKKRLFTKAAGRAGKFGAGKELSADQIVADPALGQQVTDLLTKSCLHLLGLARRVGLVELGFEKVRESLVANPAMVLITAADGALDGRGKLIRPGRRVVALFTREELSLALGRENVVHAALRPEGLGAKFLVELDRLSGFRDQVTDADKVTDDKTTEF
ncbi:DUF448 domain-containing protein [Govanella unica]|uniref:DUF448 domain-containing protein n=1 Tax=Govanella unica TaxID=2975056 RepID=A0A9X3TZT5_9PROT|nr:DUF448 domain-containing protein [Govania unica]MDA5194618.1 DUF448 domain-containing protein [Govania unica]